MHKIKARVEKVCNFSQAESTSDVLYYINASEKWISIHPSNTVMWSHSLHVKKERIYEMQ